MAAKPALNSAVKLFSLSLDPFFGTPWQANRSITYRPPVALLLNSSGAFDK
jgi:hypothetical protein